MLAVLLHGLVYLILLPPWMGEDEPWHMEYVRALAHSGRKDVPTSEEQPEPAAFSQSVRSVQASTGLSAKAVLESQAEITASMRAHHFWERVEFMGWERGANTLDQAAFNHVETYQPSLYYRLCAAALNLLGIRDVEVQLGVLRGFALLAYLAVLVVTYKIAQLVSPDRSLAVLAVLFVAWLPMHARQAAVVNNDVGVKLFAAGALWLLSLFVARGGVKPLVLALGLIALALATKATAVGLLAALAFAGIHHFAKGKGFLRYALVCCAVAAVCLALGVSYWMLISPQSQSNLAGLFPTNEAELRHHLHWVFNRYFLYEFLRTFVGTFNWSTRNLSIWIYLAVAAVMAIGLLGSLVAAARTRANLQRTVVVLCWAALSCQVLAMCVKGFAAGRFLFPVLPVLGVLVAIGWISNLPATWRPRMVRLLATGLIVVDGIALWNGLVPYQYLQWGS